jgi:hypothetical protein
LTDTPRRTLTVSSRPIVAGTEPRSRAPAAASAPKAARFSAADAALKAALAAELSTQGD